MALLILLIIHVMKEFILEKMEQLYYQDLTQKQIEEDGN